MSDVLEEKAQELAARAYAVRIYADETTDGEFVIVVETPELPGCKSHGINIREALDNLADARKEYILSLLEDNLSVPGPAGYPTAGTCYSGYMSRVIAIMNVPKPSIELRSEREKPRSEPAYLNEKIVTPYQTI